MESENRHPTAEPISVPLDFLESITSNFRKEQEIGSGAYGVVYKGILPCGSVIAVKKFHERILAADDHSFENEASSLMDIKHHNVVQLLGFCAESRGAKMMKQPDGKVFVAEEQTRMLCFEYMCNGGLDKHLSDESSGLEWNTRYKIIKGICSGLNFLHERGLVHLDLKPQNILMDATMMPKIGDFGLSRLLGGQKSYTIASNCPGTLGYMAPECIDSRFISKKADIFSLGVIIIEILKGCKDDYPDYWQSTEVFQHFKEKVLSNWRNRFERSSKYTAPELHTQLVKQCIDIALECVHPKNEKRPNVSNIIERLNAAEGRCIQICEDLRVDHQVGIQEGVPPSGVVREDGLVAVNKIALKDYALAWSTKRGPVFTSADGCSAALRYQGARNASFWVVHKALVSLEDNVLKDWAATINLGPSVVALERELKSVKWILELTLGKVIHKLALEDILMMLQELVYDAEDVLDEMDYFRIQGNVLDAGLHAEGCAHNLDLNVSPCSPQSSFHDDDDNYNYDDDDDDDDDDDNDNDNDDDDDDNNSGNYNYDDDDDNNSPELPSVHDEPPELRFDRDDAFQRIQHIVKQMQLMRQEVSSTITQLGSDWSTAPNIAQSRPITYSDSIEPKLYGRELMMKSIIHDITKGRHSAEVLTVIPIVGPGGIGKTTLAQHIYHSEEVQEHFQVRVWTCVSLNFSVKKLTEEIEGHIPKVDHESSNGRQRLKNKRLLLVLDDIWDCSDEGEWKDLLVPFQKSQVQGNIIIVTTRFPSQAQIMVGENDHSIYLQGIENKEFEEFFLRIIFGNDDRSRKEHRFLLETGLKIAGRLKGSPLAAKTVGRLLKTQLDLDHWTRVLKSKEWEQSYGKNDIMHVLKLSFDYLPSQLQQCFYCCALFPQDYKFKREELINFWIGLEVLHPSHGGNKRVEDIGLSYLTQLVNYGFLENKQGNGGRSCYIIHDLLHDLARNVSLLECLTINISQSEVSPSEILPSIHHLSINISVQDDRQTLKNSVEYFNTLDTRLKVEKLRTLMIFGEHHGCLVKAFGNLFREAKGLRVIFLSSASYNVEDLLHNFYRLIHLRYLRIGGSIADQTRFPNKLSRFYHMVILDAKHYAFIDDLPRDMSNLVKLRHFLVGDDAIHSSIVDVGKLKSLQELRRFVVKREGKGFELREIGNLVDLCGSLSIYSLEKVQVKKEADEAKLLQKDHLHELTLRWDNIDLSTNDTTLEEHVLERLKPSSNLQKLSIIGHRGGTCPSWLGMNLSLSSLKSLCLVDVAWKTFPPIGDLWLVNVPREEISINIPEKRFGNLTRLELVHLSGLQTWAVHTPCQLFPYLEVLIIRDCSQLVELSFSHSASCCQQGKEVNVNLFSRLKKLEITKCLQLSSFPPIPWTEALCSIDIQETSSLSKLVCEKENSYEYGLKIEEYGLKIEGKKDTNDGTFWNVLAFHNLTRLKVLRLRSCESLQLYYLQMLSSLRKLEMSCFSSAFPFVEADSHVKYQFPVESLKIYRWNASGKDLTQLLTYFPKLSDLELNCLEEVTGLAVNVKDLTETPGPSSSANINKVEQQQGTIRWMKLLLLPPQLQELQIMDCPKLRLRSDGRTGGGGLQGLTCLQGLRIIHCPKFLSAYSSSSFSSSFPFPNALKHLAISIRVPNSLEHLAISKDTLVVPVSNLTSLTSLEIYNCEDLRCEGLLSLLAQVHLTKLSITLTPYSFVDSEPSQSQVPEQGIPSCSSKLQELKIDDVAGFSAASIRRNLLFSSLTKLEICGDDEVEGFTEEQEALLFVNSLEVIIFSFCWNLQSLPKRLHRLPKLKSLEIWGCVEIQILPNDCLPDSLEELEIRKCPAIHSLPEVDDLPRSLQVLDVSESESEELMRQCRKLINIIPIVIVD